MTDPSTGAPGYTGPPPTTPPPAGYPGYPPGYGQPGPGYPGYGSPGYSYPGYPGYGSPGYGYPGQVAPGYGYPAYGYPWGPVGPTGPRRPGQVVAAAVLALVQAAVTAVATFYVFVLASFAAVAEGDSGLPSGVGRLATEGRIVAAVQLAGVVLLVVGGILFLVRRSRPVWWLLVSSLVLQLALAVYWLTRLPVLVGDVGGGTSPMAGFVVLALAFAAMPATGLGLASIGAGRRWFLGGEQPQAPAG